MGNPFEPPPGTHRHFHQVTCSGPKFSRSLKVEVNPPYSTFKVEHEAKKKFSEKYGVPMEEIRTHLTSTTMKPILDKNGNRVRPDSNNGN